MGAFIMFGLITVIAIGSVIYFKIVEKRNARRRFFINWVIDKYSEETKMRRDEVFLLFDKYEVSEWLYEFYDPLRTTSKGYILSEVEDMIKERSKKKMETTLCPDCLKERTNKN